MAVAVICEFNPFHNGHKFLLSQARSLSGEDVIAVMSGSFTQRGEVAVTDKFFRAETALENGADLVAEFPAVFAVANAERFAKGGVKTALSFGCVSTLAFGCETADITLLKSAALSLENENVQRELAVLMKSGEYYPRALENAVRKIYGEKTAGVLKSPNNILAVEYIRAARGRNVRFLPIKRVGAAHDSADILGGYASASKIRELLRAGKPANGLLPKIPVDITDPNKLETAALYRLRQMTAEQLRALPDISEGLENRIISAVKQNNSLDGIISAVKTKRYTHARIRRILTCALLGITEELQNTEPCYARILGFNTKGAEMLRTCRFEVVTSVAKAMKKGGKTAELLGIDIAATDTAALAYSPIKNCSADFLTKIIRNGLPPEGQSAY